MDEEEQKALVRSAEWRTIESSIRAAAFREWRDFIKCPICGGKPVITPRIACNACGYPERWANP